MGVLDAIKAQYEKNKQNNTTSSFEQDFSKYFAVRLEDGETNGELTIRLMPPNKGSDTPFEEGHWHSIQVAGKWKKLYCRKHNDDERCPLCEVERDLKETGSDEDKKLSRQFIPIFTKKGDITNPREGRDLVIILGRDDRNYTKITSIMAEDQNVLTDPKSEQAKTWMSDETVWKDVYSAPPIEYLELIADGETPLWDKNLGKFIAKGDTTESEYSVKKSVPVHTEESDEEPF